jgi:hypothetical protein
MVRSAKLVVNESAGLLSEIVERCLIPADGFYEWQGTAKKIKGDAP